MEGLTSIDVSNVLSEEKRQQVIALGRLGSPLRRIQQETGIRRETAGAHLKAAGIAIRAPGGWGRRAPAKPANGVPRLFAEPAAGALSDGQRLRALLRFHRTVAEQGTERQGHLPGLGGRYGFMGPYASVKRFVGRLRGQSVKSGCAVIVTPPAEEAQADYGSGPMVRDPHSGRYRRTRLFVLTLGYSRKVVRLVTFQSSTRTWAELHEQAFRRLVLTS
jgi:hypothetical protein